MKTLAPIEKNVYNNHMMQVTNEDSEGRQMIAIIGAILMLVVITISILLLCGLPLGELTMGGQYRVFPKKMKTKETLNLKE